MEVLAAVEVTASSLLVDLLWKRFFRVVASVEAEVDVEVQTKIESELAVLLEVAPRLFEG